MSSKNGVLLLSKPRGMTSFGLVGCVRKKLGLKAVGHAGTLDPEAEGLMILLVGLGTKISDFLLNQDKQYRAEVRLGVETDSYDRAGAVTKETEVGDIDDVTLQSVVEDLKEPRLWPVPIYSAKKVDGRRLCDRVRAGEEILEIPQKEMSFAPSDFARTGANTFEVTLDCLKGSFVRSWAHEIGQRLGVGAHLSRLVRLRSGGLRLSGALSFEDFESLEVSEILNHETAFLKLSDALPSDYHKVTVSGADLSFLNNGQISKALHGMLTTDCLLANRRKVQVVNQRGDLVALLEAPPYKPFLIQRVFKLDGRPHSP